MTETVRLLLVDDHELICSSMARLIEKASDRFKVCGLAGNAAQAMTLIRALEPDVSLIDISFNGREGGLELMSEVHADFPDHKMLAVSLHDEDLYAERALQAGARGYLAKGEVGRQVIIAIEEVLQGRLYISGKSGPAIIEKYLAGSR